MEHSGELPTFPEARAGSPPPESGTTAARKRCGAMLQVVKGENGKWRVTRFVPDHNHALLPALAGTSAPATDAVKVGMEFDSVDAAKALFYVYAERMGFNARMGSNRRSVGSGDVIMQRFICSNGNYAAGRKEEGAGEDSKKKRKQLLASSRRKCPEVREIESTLTGNQGSVSLETIEDRSLVDLGDLVKTHAQVKCEKTKGDGGVLTRGRRKRMENGPAEKSKSDKGEGTQRILVDKEKINLVNIEGHSRWRLVEADKADVTGDEKSAEMHLEKDRGDSCNEDSDDTNQAAYDKDNFCLTDSLDLRQRDGESEKDQEKRERLAYGLNCVEKQVNEGASRCSNEERRKLLNKFLTKRHRRPSTGRTSKAASRHTSTEMCERGDAENIHPSELKEDEHIEGEPDPPTDIITDLGGEPSVGMLFLNEEMAFKFYVNYAGTMGFNVRKGWWDKTGRNASKSRTYMCSKGGNRAKNMKVESKKSCSDTRTGCQAHMTIKVTVSGKYVVTEFAPDHNHELDAPLECIQIVTAEKLVPMLQVSSPSKVVMIPNEYKNYLRLKRRKSINPGDAKTICEYLQRMKGSDPSFFYAIQVDEDDQLVNIFWSDAKSMMDFHYFDDVVCFDTRYSTGDSGRPLALFIGVNHHKQLIIFGAAFLYDDSAESLKWLFETFRSAMRGKQPKILFTDNIASVSDSVSAVWTSTVHRLSSFHIYQNAMMVLKTIFETSQIFAEDFGKCLFDIDEEHDLFSAWDLLLQKYDLKTNEWLSELYGCRERWALPYGRELFSADIMVALRLENIDNLLKDHLKMDTDFVYFFEHYEKFMEEKRLAEQQADYFASQITPGVAQPGLLWQASNIYTPAAFELVRLEFELSLTCIVYSAGNFGPLSDYEVSVKNSPRSHVVRFDSAECAAICSCKKFESAGIPCCHILKVFDIRNVKELPLHYILKRWTKEAKIEPPNGSCDLSFDDDRSTVFKHYNHLCRVLCSAVERAVENQEAYAFLENQLEEMLEKVEQILSSRSLNKSPTIAEAKSHQNSFTQGEANSNTDLRKAGGKKSRNAESRQKNQSPLESTKLKKARQAFVMTESEVQTLRLEESAVPSDVQLQFRTPSNQRFLPPNQLMQPPYVPVPVPVSQFGLGSFQGFQGLPQFSQMQGHSTSLQQSLQQPLPLQPSPFHASNQLTQAPPPDMQALQFLTSNTQPGQQNADQPHYTIPVWDFL